MNIGTLFGDNDLENMFQRIDGLKKSLSKNIKRSDPDITDAALREMLKVIQDDDGQVSSETTDINKLLGSLSISTNRIMRYNTYDEIYRNVSLLKRVISVYLNNTLQIDVITNSALQIKACEGNEESNIDVAYYKKYSEKLLKYFEIEKELKQTIIPSMLKYGDHFIELINILDDVVDFRPLKQQQQVITESNLNSLQLKINDLNVKNNITNKYAKKTGNIDVVESMTKLFIEMDDITTMDTDVYSAYSYVTELKKSTSDTTKKQNNFDESKLRQVLLRFHQPKKISILRTEYGTVIGYVEINTTAKLDVTPGVATQFAQVINDMGSEKTQVTTNSSIIKGIINNIISNLIKKIDVPKSEEVNGKKLSQKEVLLSYEKAIHNQLGDELFILVKQLFIEVNPNNRGVRKLNVRFISKDRMIHLCHNPIEYDPYGTSVLDCLVYPAKLYMLTQLSNVMHKLSRSSQIRKWTLETGPREHHSGLVQKLKRELRNQRVSVEDVMSFKSIPNILSDFKDIVLLSKKGQRFVDVDMQQMGDPNVRIADLEDFRRELIALSGVPAPYLGYNDVIELRDHLVHINVTFAAEIINVQQVINDGMQELTYKIGKILKTRNNENPNDFVRISLRPPVVLLLQMIETVMASITNIQQNLQSTDIKFNPFYLLKRFLPTIDWDEFSKDADLYELFKKAKGQDKEDPMNAGGAGGRY